MIDINSVNIYFASSHESSVWTAYPIEARIAAIASARRIFGRALGRALNDNEAAYQEGDMYREEYAVAEQALYLLRTGKIADGQSNSPYPVAMPTSEHLVQAPKARPHPMYSETALRWLGNYNSICVIRG